MNWSAMANKLGKVLEIEWEDAWSNDGSWTEAEAQSQPPLVMVLYGHCIRDDKAGITLAMERRKDKADRYRIIWHVPRAMVRKVTVLK